MTGIRKLIWASWFIGTGMIVLSWLRLVDHNVGWYGFYIFGAGWLVSLVTSKQLSFRYIESHSSDEPSDLDRQTIHEYRASISRLTRKLDDSPRNRSELLATRGAYYRALGNWEAAITDLDAALACDPDCDGSAYLDRAIVLLKTDKPDRALIDVEKAIARLQTDHGSHEKYEWARRYRHDILLTLERFEALIGDCDQMLMEPGADELAIRLTRGIALTASGRNSESLNDLSTVIDEFSEEEGDGDKSLKSALSARAGAYLRAGEVEYALTDIRRLQTMEGLTADNMNLMGIAEIKSNDYRAALNCHKKAASLDASAADNYYKLALIQSGCPDVEYRDGTQAKVNARKACELTKWNDWNCISVLAAAKAEQGDFDQAVEFAEWAHRLAPDQEKEERQKRIEQFQNGEPFRLGDALPRTVYRRQQFEN